jgi:hypothetical protein
MLPRIEYNNNVEVTSSKQIGNAYLNDDTNTRATIDYYWTHAMISKETHKAVQENCSFNGTYTGLCRTAIEAANNEKGLIDQSNIYASFCWDASVPRQYHASVKVISQILNKFNSPKLIAWCCR